MRAISRIILTAFAAVLALLLPACNTETTPTPKPEPSRYVLEYRLLDAYPDYFWCDPDEWPIPVRGGEEANSITRFPAIRANPPEFAAILERLELPDRSDYTAEEKLAIYREHKKLTFIIRLTPSDTGFDFWLSTDGEDQSFCVEGSITFEGRISESKREVCFLTCPVCLTRGTLIDAPSGPIRVDELTTGAMVWTTDEVGHREEARVVETSATPVPPGFEVVRVTLADGRTVTASPNHPGVDQRPLDEYQVGEILDGSAVAAVEHVRYRGGFTYDLRPAGSTGAYWANGILLKSTLANGSRSARHDRPRRRHFESRFRPLPIP